MLYYQTDETCFSVAQASLVYTRLISHRDRTLILHKALKVCVSNVEISSVAAYLSIKVNMLKYK